MKPLILFAWEMGGNFGHLSRDLAIAEQLRTEGYEVTFIVRDPEIANQLLTPARFPFLPCPFPPRKMRLSRPAANYAEIMLAHGYLDSVMVNAVVQQWLHLYELIKPVLVVIDHAPTALLAARIKGLKTIAVGTGFEIPPNTFPLPSLRPWETLPRPRLEVADRSVTSIINAVLAANKRPPLKQLSDLFADTFALLTTFAELDHYAGRQGREYIGPVTAEFSAPHGEWPTHGDRKILIYLRAPVPQLEIVLSGLAVSGSRTVCVMPTLSHETQRRFSNPQTYIHTSPISMQSLYPSADIVINHGSASTIASSLTAGVPMLLLPTTVEQYLGAHSVKQLGAGILLPGKPPKVAIEKAIATLLDDDKIREAAKNFSLRHKDYLAASSLQRIVGLICRLATTSPPPVLTS